VPWRKIIQFFLLVVGIAAGSTLLIAWRSDAMTTRQVADLSVMVSIAIAILSLSFIGPGTYSEAHRLEEDIRSAEYQHSLSNRARGVLGLAGAATWMTFTNVIAYVLH